MTGFGTLLNIITVVGGSAAGLALRKGLPERVKRNILIALGLSTLLVGIQEGLHTQRILIPIGALLLGGILGEFLQIESRMESLGGSLERRIQGASEGLSKGFITASLLFCVGPIAIWGSIQDGMGEGFRILAIKSLLDGFASVALASTLGIGVMLSAVAILVIQGSLTLAAGTLDPLLNDPMRAEISATGGLLVMAIGLTLLDLRKIPIANYVPALAVAPILVILTDYLRVFLPGN